MNLFDYLVPFALAAVVIVLTLYGIAFEHLPLSTFGWVLFSALGSTVIGQGAMSILLQRHPVSTVVPLTLHHRLISGRASGADRV